MDIDMKLPVTPIIKLCTDQSGNELYVKREDLLPYSFGGNKLRIALEYIADMKRRGYDEIIAYGNARSNLCRVLSNLCCEADIACTVLSPADDDGSREDSYNLLMSRCFGANIVPCLKTDVASAVDAAMEASIRAGRKPYYIYGDRTGRGNRVTPVRAYVKAYNELAAQESELGFQFDTIYLACATGTTMAGLICGASLAGESRDFIGISVARSAQSAAMHVENYIKAYFGSAGGEPMHDVTIDDSYAIGYGRFTDDMALCARDALRLYGLPLDLTYTGKAFYGMRRRLDSCHGQRVLFIHTGGAPLFFDQARAICDAEV